MPVVACYWDAEESALMVLRDAVSLRSALSTNHHVRRIPVHRVGDLIWDATHNQ